MPRTQRSPPANPPNKNIQAMSDSDIPQLMCNSTNEINNTTRKRPRPFSSPIPELHSFKEEIQDMLASWKKDYEMLFHQFCTTQTSSLNKIVTELTEIRHQNSAIQKSNLEIEKSITFINKQYEDMVKQIDNLQKEKQIYRDSIQSLETKIQDIQRFSRPSSIEIRNIPSEENESASELIKIVTKLSSTVDVTVNDSHIRDVYRLPGREGTVRPIVAELINVHLKNQLLTAVRSFNKRNTNDNRLSTHSIGMTGHRRLVYLSEHLPASSRKLFYAAKEFAKLRNYNFCWTINGNIFLRKAAGHKHILIKSQDTLRELQQKSE